MSPFESIFANLETLGAIESGQKVLGYIDTGEKEGAKLLADGRNFKKQGYENGYFVGPTLFDRLLAANIIGTNTVLFLVMYGYLTGRTDFLDIAIAYILLNLIGTFAVLKYFRYGTLSHGEED